MEINKNTEIRHLPANILEVLAQTLNDSWQRVMEAIPQELLDNNEIDFVNNSSKYSPDQINLVQEHCMVHKIKFPALILFEEWGSSGKIRPTMGHLVEILSKLKIFVAADYLCNILNETCPVRPLEGPAAPLDLTSFEDEPSNQIVSNYGDNRNNSDDNNKGYSNQNKVQLPKVHNSVLPSEQPLAVVNRNPQTRTTNSVSVDILPIQNSVISEDLLAGPIPNIFELNSNISISSTKSNANKEVNQTNDRNLSGILLPNFYELMKSESMNSNSLPNFEELCKSNIHETNDNVTNGYGEINIIPYFNIQSATDNFNDRCKLGEGGFSTVYLATDLIPACKYSAVKRFKDLGQTSHFYREIELLKNVEHENLIKLLGYSSHLVEICIVYEYINGDNLYKILENCRLDKIHLHWKNRIEIARGCSNGIKYLHDINIIHRNIKSSNILLDGIIPKICDFGFVKNPNFNSTRMSVGTNPYMAPETGRGNVSIAVDVFAFGVVILELVSGFNVLDDSKPDEVIDLVTHFETSVKQTDYHLAFTDKKAGDWKHLNFTQTAAEKMLELASKCLLSKIDRLKIENVNIELTKIDRDFCT